MAKHLEIQNMDDIFLSIQDPVVLNDLPSNTIEERDHIKRLIMVTYDQVDILSSTPTCSCGELTTGIKLGRVCGSCNTLVERPAEDSIDLKVWLRAPEDTPGFITPALWIQLSKVLTTSKYNLLEWICNRRVKLPARVSATITDRIAYLESNGWVRGLWEFHNNFDRFLTLLPGLKIKECNDLVRYLRSNKNLLFCNYLPMPTKALLVLDNTYVASFADLSITAAKDAAYTILELTDDSSQVVFTPQALESKTVSIIRNLANFYDDTFTNSVCDRKGWLRGQLFSSRVHSCVRSVITSINEPHHYEDIHIPWAQALVIMMPLLLNKLLARGYSIKSAHALVESSGNVFNVTLNDIFIELLADVPVGKVNFILQRNPSLRRNSAQAHRLTKVKTNLNDKTISFSDLALRGPNSDFDGDEMNGQLMLDIEMMDAAELIRPHYGIHSLMDIGRINNVPSLPDPTVVTISRWLMG